MHEIENQIGNLIREIIRGFPRASVVMYNRKSLLNVHKYADFLNLSPWVMQRRSTHEYAARYRKS